MASMFGAITGHIQISRTERGQIPTPESIIAGRVSRTGGTEAGDAGDVLKKRYLRAATIFSTAVNGFSETVTSWHAHGSDGLPGGFGGVAAGGEEDGLVAGGEAGGGGDWEREGEGGAALTHGCACAGDRALLLKPSPASPTKPGIISHSVPGSGVLLGPGLGGEVGVVPPVDKVTLVGA